MFDLQSCLQRAEAGQLQDWVLEYLANGYWANPGLRDGLLLHKRYWIGPLPIELSKLGCGPEAGMAYHVPVDIWQERTERIAAGLVDAESLPPLIVESWEQHLIVRDGNHRLGAMTLLCSFARSLAAFFPFDFDDEAHA